MVFFLVNLRSSLLLEEYFGSYCVLSQVALWGKGVL